MSETRLSKARVGYENYVYQPPAESKPVDVVLNGGEISRVVVKRMIDMNYKGLRTKLLNELQENR
jgi:hypothetical protein